MGFNRGQCGFNRSKLNSDTFSSVVYSTPSANSTTAGAALSDKIFFAVPSADTLSEGQSAAATHYTVGGGSETTGAGVCSAGILSPGLMRDVAHAVIALLKADAQVTAHTDMRIYRRKLPRGPSFPAITVTTVSDIRDTITNTGGYARARVQVTAWAQIPGAEADLAHRCADTLHRRQNSILTYGSGASASIVYIVSVQDAGGIPDENTKIPLYMEHRDFMVHYDYR